MKAFNIDSEALKGFMLIRKLITFNKKTMKNEEV